MRKMTSTQSAPNPFAFPRLRTTVKRLNSVFWDVKFYPFYGSDDDQAIFAIADENCLLICHLSEHEEFDVKVLHAVRLTSGYSDEQFDLLNTCEWCYVTPTRPLVATSGYSGHIKIIDALDGEIFGTLLGHGMGTINDMATHPRYPWIIASASMDASIRIWDLRRVNEQHETTCVIICGHGQAHKEGLLTVSWHGSGRYLITGGHDLRMCVWTIPDLGPDSSFWQEISKENRNRSADETRVIHYPHFMTSAIHSNYIDKAVFFGDLVISKSARDNKIVLWEITGFSSQKSPPDLDMAPKTNEYLDTRNGFVRKMGALQNGELSTTVDARYKGLPLYQRHLEFNSPFCESFYMRFGLLQPTPAHPHVHPMLTMGNTASQISHWDLERLNLGHDKGWSDSHADQNHMNMSRKPMAKFKKGTAKIVNQKERLNNMAFSQSPGARESTGSSSATPSTLYPRETSTEATSHTSEPHTSIEGMVADRVKYDLSDPHKPLVAHKKYELTDFKSAATYFTTRAVDWSPCGRWCVVVGESTYFAGGRGQPLAVAAIMERNL